MAYEIGRLNSFGLGKESIPGTAVSPTVWIPVETGNLKPVVEQVKDTSGLGTIVENSNNFIQKQMSEFTASGNVYSQSFGHILLGTFGTVAAPSLLETGVYKHDFSLAETNSHTSYTIVRDNATQEERAPYSMVESLAINVNEGEQIKFDLTMMGQQIADTSGNTATFLGGLSAEPFYISQVSVKIADDIASL